jgi:hypothetical protein
MLTGFLVSLTFEAPDCVKDVVDACDEVTAATRADMELWALSCAFEEISETFLEGCSFLSEDVEKLFFSVPRGVLVGVGPADDLSSEPPSMESLEEGI